MLSLALDVRGVVKKTRYLYMVGQTRVHVDQVDNLGDFMELEVCCCGYYSGFGGGGGGSGAVFFYCTAAVTATVFMVKRPSFGAFSVLSCGA